MNIDQDYIDEFKEGLRRSAPLDGRNMLATLERLVPKRGDVSAINTDVWESLKFVVGAAQKTYALRLKSPQTVGVTDELGTAFRILDRMGCSSRDCDIPRKSEPMHIYAHVNTFCDATVKHDEWAELNGVCPWCSAGVQNNLQRTDYWKARDDYRARRSA